MVETFPVIGVTGVAQSGKDTFFNILNKELELVNIKSKRFALADALKEQANGECLSRYGISSLTTDSDEKKIIRPFLVEFGKNKRLDSKGRFWVDLLDHKVREFSKVGVAVVTDIRYCLYEGDELYWILKELKGEVVHVKRFIDGQEVQPPNEDEKKYDPILWMLANYHIEWETEKSNNFYSPQVRNFRNYLTSKYNLL